MSAAERREEIVEIAVGHFARGGFSGTSTEAIAREAGVSQPYLFRLFGTKKELFLACSERMTQRIIETFERAAATAPADERVSAMGAAYADLLESDRTLLRMQLQSHAAAAADADVRARAAEEYLRVADTARRLGDLDEETLGTFVATGMLLNVLAALDLESLDRPPG